MTDVTEFFEAGATGVAILVRWLVLAGLATMSLSILLALARLLRGPRLADRAAALDVIGFQFVGLIILLTMLGGTLLFVDGVLVLSLLSFAGTLAAAQFIARPFVTQRNAEADPADDDVPDRAALDNAGRQRVADEGRNEETQEGPR